MKLLMMFLFLATCMFHSPESVQVTDSGYTFRLEAVKTLKQLMGSDASGDPLQSISRSAVLCADPDLPPELAVVCEEDDAERIFRNLVTIITSTDPCEICANAACTGCL